MGLTHIKVNIANPARPRRAVELNFLVDSGAVYSVIPAALLRRLGVRPHSKRVFTLADGSEITRKIGDVLFRLDGRQGAAPVIFGEKQDSILLGTVSLEALGMMLDPMKRELRPLPMLLSSHLARTICNSPSKIGSKFAGAQIPSPRPIPESGSRQSRKTQSGREAIQSRAFSMIGKSRGSSGKN